MASSPLTLQCHVRSVSLPSRLIHPLSIKIEAELNKLKTSLSTTNYSNTGTIQTGLVGLADLYSFVEELIQSPVTQTALVQHHQGILIEEGLESSIGLLDLCGAMQDLLSTMKAHVQDLQSALRRKGGDLSIESNIKAYICFRKRVKKDIAKSLRTLKDMENKLELSSSLLDINHHLSIVIRVTSEVTVITISVFRSLLMFFSVSDLKKPSGWSMIKSLMPTKSLASERWEMVMNEVGRVDMAVYSLHGCTRNNDNKADVQMTRKRLQMLETSIEGLEVGLDRLFKKLIQSRVSLLNILAH